MLYIDWENCEKNDLFGYATPSIEYPDGFLGQIDDIINEEENNMKNEINEEFEDAWEYEEEEDGEDEFEEGEEEYDEDECESEFEEEWVEESEDRFGNNKKPNFYNAAKMGLAAVVIAYSSFVGFNQYKNNVGFEVYKFEGRDKSSMPDYELTVNKIGEVYIEEHSRGESNRQILYSQESYDLFTSALNFCELNKNGKKLTLLERINQSSKTDTNNDRQISKEESQAFYDVQRQIYFKKKK